MEKLLIYLQSVSLRSSLAARLERIAIVFVEHARYVCDVLTRYVSWREHRIYITSLNDTFNRD